MNSRSKNVAFYLAATLVSAASSFLYIPLLVKTVGLEEFGKWVLFEPLLLLLPQLGALGLNFGVVKQLSHDKIRAGVILRSYIPRALPAFALIGLISLPLTMAMGLELHGALCFTILLVLESIILLFQGTLRGADQARAFASTLITKSLVILVVLALSTNLPVPKLNTVEDVISCWLVASFAAAFVSSTGVLGLLKGDDKVESGQQRDIWWDAVRYGFPLLLLNLLSLFVVSADRYFLRSIITSESLAAYVAHIKVASILNTAISTPFGLWWPTERFRNLSSESGGESFFIDIANSIAAIYLTAGGLLYFFSPFVFGLLIPGAAFDKEIMLGLIFATIVTGMAAPLNVGLFNTGETHKNIYSALAAALTSFILLGFLVPQVGVVGAVAAANISSLVFVVVQNRLSQKVIKVKFDYTFIVGLSIWGIAALLALSRYAVGNDNSILCMVALGYVVWMLLGIVILRNGKKANAHI